VPETNPSPLPWKPVPLPRPVPLRGRTVTLEPLDAANHSAALWRALQGHDDLWTWMSASPSQSAAEMVAGLEQWQKKEKAVILAIVPADTAKAAGWAAFMRIEPAHGVIEVGNVMFSPSLQRTRAATEAMYLMARHIFDDLGYRRYEWKCNARNEPSRRAAQRLGFTFEGIFRQHQVVKGFNRDTAWFSMLDREWPARKQAFEAWLDPANFDSEGRQRQNLTSMVPQPCSAPSRVHSSSGS
jgi:RimJ/RimL family protein N-acetyltransferase